jgi:hypothetical protein
VKRIETRSRKTNHRGPIAIHAALRIKLEQMEAFDALLEHETIRLAFEEDGVDSMLALPFGCVVATAELVDCRPVCALPRELLTDTEIALGAYTGGLYGWILNNVVRLEKPVPARGRQGFFEVSV